MWIGFIVAQNITTQRFNLLMEILRDGRTEEYSETDMDQQQDPETPSNEDPYLIGNRRLSNAKQDEVLAATAILCVYEFLDASGPAWNRHLSGAKSLLDVAQASMMQLESQTVPSRPPLKLSKARRAIFWNFARQDYLSACEFRRPTSLVRVLANPR